MSTTSRLAKSHSHIELQAWRSCLAYDYSCVLVQHASDKGARHVALVTVPRITSGETTGDQCRLTASAPAHSMSEQPARPSMGKLGSSRSCHCLYRAAGGPVLNPPARRPRSVVCLASNFVQRDKINGNFSGSHREKPNSLLACYCAGVDAGDPSLLKWISTLSMQ